MKELENIISEDNLGFWFVDDMGSMHGPYGSKEETIEKIKNYAKDRIPEVVKSLQQFPDDKELTDLKEEIINLAYSIFGIKVDTNDFEKSN